MKKYAIIITNLFNIIMNLNNCRFEMFSGLNQRLQQSLNDVDEDDADGAEDGSAR